MLRTLAQQSHRWSGSLQGKGRNTNNTLGLLNSVPPPGCSPFLIPHSPIDTIEGSSMVLTISSSISHKRARLQPHLHYILGGIKADEPSDGKASQQFVSQRLSLGNSTQSPVLHPFRIQLYAALGELEPLLDNGRQFPDPPAVFTCSATNSNDGKQRSLLFTMNQIINSNFRILAA